MLFRQRVISPKNIGMATEWAASEDSEVAALAQIVADVGRVCPGRRKRMQKIRSGHPALWARMVAAGAIDYDQLESSRTDYEDDAEELADPAGGADVGGLIAPDLVTGDEDEAVEDEDEIPF